MARPFRVFKVSDGQWWLTARHWGSGKHYKFPSQAEAIDYAYRNWPWWP